MVVPVIALLGQHAVPIVKWLAIASICYYAIMSLPAIIHPPVSAVHATCSDAAISVHTANCNKELVGLEMTVLLYEDAGLEKQRVKLYMTPQSYAQAINMQGRLMEINEIK